MALIVASAAAAPAQAETLEVAFWNRAATLLEDFRKNDYNTVGVLKFHFQKGVDGKLTHTAGSLNANAARRLETALVLELAKGQKKSNGKEIMIVRDASATAAAIPKADHLGAGWQRERLFAPIYTPSWGTQKFVFPDAFVTGKLILHDNLAKMTVQLQVFDKKNLSVRALNAFDVDVRTDTLIETGHNLRSIDPDKLAAQAPKIIVPVTPENPAKTPTETAVKPAVPPLVPDVNPKLPAAITGGGTAVQPVGTTAPVSVAPKEDVLKAAPVELQIFYDNKPVALNFVNGEYFVEAPKPGQKVLFGMVRRDNAVDAKYGVVLQLNGMCTLGMERKPPAECQRWVFEKNDPAGFVGGFFKGNKEVSSFTVVPPSKELQTEYKENLGTISYTIFKEGPTTPAPNPTLSLKDQVAEAKITKLIAQGANVQTVQASEPAQPVANPPVVVKKDPETKPEIKPETKPETKQEVVDNSDFPTDLPLRSLTLLRDRLEDLAAQPLRNVALRNAIIPGEVQTIDPLRTTSFVNPGMQMSVTIRYFKAN